MKQELIEKSVGLPDETDVKVEADRVIVKGPRGSAEKAMVNPRVSIVVKDKTVIVSAKKATKREKKVIGTFCAHIRNLIKGVNEGHVYKLKVCSGHFPMNITISDNKVSVKNFLGEKVPRKINLKGDVNAKVEGDIITIESSSKESAAQAAADIEQATKRSAYDKRIFQDGIYIIHKDGKDIK